MIQFDSRLIKKGDVFVALKGLTQDGNDYIDEAIKNGASKIYKNSNVVELGKLASDYFDDPSLKIKVIGVTGTKGKTTTCHLIHHILESLGHKTGLISSITTSGLHTTTPDIITLNQELSKMVKENYEYVVLEVSSHGIDQGRISGINFYATVLTNIKPEHLDYHKSFKVYKDIKMRFYKLGKIKIKSPEKTKLNILPGEFNNINVETAVQVAEELGIRKEEAIKTLKTFKLPEGRLEEIKNNNGYRIFVDFAHTPDSLEKVLLYLKSLKPRRLISVFGCAGERDHKKRSKMGKISTQIADFSVFTAEDPRFEYIFDILKQMKSKAIEGKFVAISERGEAIAYALSIAKKGDVIGIFGKGHEKTMCYQNYEHPWSDKETIKNYLNKCDKVSAVILAAGKGTRMKSSRPKVIHEICGRPMIVYTLENLRKAKIEDIVTVVSFKKNLVINKIKGAVKIAIQKNPKGGTADAAKAGYGLISKNSDTLLIINGDDSAFYTPNTIQEIIKIHSERERKLTFVSLIKDNPTGLGRVIRGKNGLITKIVEEKDATDEERKIKEVNDGLYIFDKSWFTRNIKKVNKGPQGEYYLVDLIKLAIDQKDKMATYTLPNDNEWHGINTPEQLIDAEEKMKQRLNEKIYEK